ncbi:MAG: hypothetical protein IJ266_05365, partial [Elusimicrobiaceae bacterium]|nr:hypothetical protein [Elusimicrobiaceae bacterium]
MPHKLSLFISILYVVMLCQTASAQKLPKIPKTNKLPAVSATTAKTLSPAHQAALLHAQALRNIQVERSIATAVQEQLHTPPVITSMPNPKPTTVPSAMPASMDLSAIDWHKHKTPRQWLEILKTFVQQYGRLPTANPDHWEFSIFRGINHTLNNLDPQDPIALRIKKIKQQYARSGNSPQQWLELLEAFVAKEGRWPTSTSSPAERALYQGVTNAIKRLGPQDPTVQRMYELKEQYPSAHVITTPQQWLQMLEDFVNQEGHWPSSRPRTKEGNLYSNIQNISHHLDPQDPVAQRIRELRTQYSSKYSPKTPAQWLEELEHFIQQNGRFPGTSPASEKELYSAIHNTIGRLGPQDPISVRAIELKQRYMHYNFKTPQQWLDVLEEFIAREGRYPKQNRSPEERTLQQSIHNCLQKYSIQDPVIARMHELKEKYAPQTHKKENLLRRLEQFVDAYERFPEPS